MNATIDIAATGRYPIGKAADLLGISRNTLRSHAKSGMIKSGISRNGRLVFRGIDLITFWKTNI